MKYKAHIYHLAWCQPQSMSIPFLPSFPIWQEATVQEKTALILEGSGVTTACAAWHAANRKTGGKGWHLRWLFSCQVLVWPPGDCCQRHWPDTCCQRQAMEELVHYGHFASCTCIPEDLSAFPWPQWDCFTQRSQDWGVSPGDWGAHDKPDKTISYLIKKKVSGTSLVVQWLRLQAPSAGGLGSISGHGTRSHMPQL